MSLAAVVPTECHMWGYNPENFSARFAWSKFIPPLLKLWRRPCDHTLSL